MKELRGICVALCTPFTEDGEQLDEPALGEHIDSMLEAGAHSILVCGGTGEFAYLRPDERKRIVEITSKHIGERVPLMVQTSAVNTRDAIEYSRHAQEHGADFLLILPPYFEGPDADGVYYHYERIGEAVDVPIVVYNIPECSGFDITPQFLQRLMEIDNVRYIKDSTADLVRIQELLRVGGDRIGIINGADSIALYSLVAGCPGCIWGGPNAMPQEAVQLYELVAGGELGEARQLWERMLPAQLFFDSHVYNPAVKAATNLSGRKVGPCRKPQLPLTPEELAELKDALRPLGL